MKRISALLDQPQIAGSARAEWCPTRSFNHFIEEQGE